MIRLAVLALLLGFVMAPPPAEAKQARCYNSDDGYYACLFEQYGGDGSFTVTAPTKPTFSIEMRRRGLADGYVDFGGGDVDMPGPFRRSGQDRACWVSDATSFTLCVY